MFVVYLLLNECDMILQDFFKIVVVKGSGLYIGVRIGVMFVKMFVWFLYILIFFVLSFEVFVVNGWYFDGLISFIFDVRWGQVYIGLYEYKNGFLE